MLTLIYKKHDPLSLSNYRPITLLNTDTKLIADVLTQRFKKVLPLIISNDQNGYIKNRYICFNIRQIQDFSKAFDSVEWEFMFKSLERFGFQESI